MSITNNALENENSIMKQAGFGGKPSLRNLVTIIMNRKWDQTANELAYSDGKKVPKASNTEILKRFIRSNALNKLDYVTRNRRSGSIFELTPQDITKVEKQLLCSMNDVVMAFLLI
jgi:hypothetical protein